jgi:cysteine desulfurase
MLGLSRLHLLYYSSMKLPIYLDYHATTPVDPRVLEAMLPYFTEVFGNAASIQHPYGAEAKAAVDKAREQIAHILNAQAREIVFTSGATEANNLAIKGIMYARREQGKHIITCTTEHKAVLDICRQLEAEGFKVTYLPVSRDGHISLEELEHSITKETVLVSLMAANNEIGTLHPLKAIGAICSRHGVAFHTDATQAVGKIPLDVENMQIDLLSMSAHKFYGPKGIGALYVRKRGKHIKLAAQMLGGGHEGGLRSGTLNVPLIVGMGKALDIAEAEMKSDEHRIRELRDLLLDKLQSSVDGITVNGDLVNRLYNNLNIQIKGVRSSALMVSMKEIAISAGSACTSAVPQPSHVLKAIGLTNYQADCSIRIGLGRGTTREEVDYLVRRLTEVAPKLRRQAASFSH